MYFPNILVFTAIIMVCGITDMVEAQYRFPIYYRIARRMEGENKGMKEIEDKQDSKLGTIECGPEFCRWTKTPTHPNTPTDEGDKLGEKNQSKIDSDRDGTMYQLFHRRSPRPTSWRIDGNEDKENSNEKQALIQRLLLKSWNDWNKKIELENGNEDYSQ